MRKSVGFTIVEVIVIIAVIGILAGIGVIGYGAWQKNTAKKVVSSDLQQAQNAMNQKNNFAGSYPSDISELSSLFTPSQDVSLSLTNPGSLPVYSGLTPNQNATLFVKLCNDNMPMQSPDKSTTYTTSCVGQWGMDVTGGSHNSYLSTPINSGFSISTCPGCTDPYYMPYNTVALAFQNKLTNDFIASGGTFPVILQNNPPTTLPTPAPAASTGQYCIQGANSKHTGIVQHITASGTPQDGPC